MTMASDSESNVQQFKVYRTSDNKEKYLRVFTLSGKPTLQVSSVRRDSFIREFDISLASKVFKPIVGDGTFQFKLLLKVLSDDMSYYCNDRHLFNECIECINKVLRKYHQRRHSMDSVPMRISSTSSTSQNGDEGIYIEMNSPLNQERRQSQWANGRVEVTNGARKNQLRRISSSYRERCMTSRYSVPEFNINDAAFDGVCDNLPVTLGTEVLDSEKNIMQVLKLREEILWSGGVLFCVSRDVMFKIDVTEYNKELWISKVNVEDKRFHVGDRVCTINYEIVNKIVQFTQFSKFENLNLRLQRLPKAKAFAISNESLKTSYNKDLVFSNSEISRKDNWIINEIDFVAINDERDIHRITDSNTPYHVIVLHQSAFLKQLRDRRKSTLK